MFKENVRPIGALVCIVTLCILAVFDGCGASTTPQWAIGILGAVAGEWLIERGVRKSKGGE